MQAERLAKVSMFARGLIILGCALSACTARPPKMSHGANRPLPAVRMHHQVAFDNNGEQHVFDGIMIQEGSRFVVQAFAGPGVDLFTVRRAGRNHDEKLHIPALSDKIPIARIATDIARTYLPGCPARSNLQTVCECPLLKEPLEESFDVQGRLRRRHYPEADGVGLTIHYSEHRFALGAHRPQLIRLHWGDGTRAMTIRTTQIDTLTIDANNNPWVELSRDVE